MPQAAWLGLGVTWWCSAQGLPWAWSWQAYPGVWLLVASLAGASWLAVRTAPLDRRVSRRERWLMTSGVVAVWVALDWPVGALGAGYLLSVHQLQYVLLVMVAPPLLILGTPSAVLRHIMGLPGIGTAARWLTRPVLAILACNLLVVLTHLPQVVDRLMPYQLGSFAVDVSWFGAGLLLWWPVISKLPDVNGLSHPARLGYLLVATLIPGIPSAFYFFADYPIYALYELAPPVGLLPAADDQFLAGIVMKLGSFAIVLSAMSMIFFRWHRSDNAPHVEIKLPPAIGDSRLT